MKKIKKFTLITLSTLLVVLALVLTLLHPVLTFGQVPPYEGPQFSNRQKPAHNASKKTIFVIADNKQTEMFDMLAPFYVFNATDSLNVYIVAKNETPIPIKNDLYVLPQFTFAQVEVMQLKADVIVIPALFARDENQDPTIIGFIKTHFEKDTRLIAICDGATTAAATGLYDGKPITAHATDYKCVKKHFDKPVWTQNVTVTQSGNLYSTAGVANAVDGSLLIVGQMLGEATRTRVAKSINYPHQAVPLQHKSIALSFGNKMSIVKRMLFKKKKQYGLLLHDGLNELQLAAMVDTYSRTFPGEYKTFALQGNVVVSKYGLTFIHAGDNTINPKMDEVHVIMPELLTAADAAYFKGYELVKQNNTEYTIDQCLTRIAKKEGEHYKNIVKVTLDYN